MLSRTLFYRATLTRSATPRSAIPRSAFTKRALTLSPQKLFFATGSEKATQQNAPTQKQEKIALALDLSVNPSSHPAEFLSSLHFEGFSGKAAANLFAYGGITNSRNIIAKEMETIIKQLENPESYLSNAFNIPDQEAFHKAIKEFQSKYSPFMKALFDFLMDSGAFKEKILSLTAQRYLKMIQEVEGNLEGIFVTPKPISDKMLADWKKEIEREYLNPGQSITLKKEVDPSLISGYKLMIGNDIYDNSISSSLQNANTQKSALEEGKKILRKDAMNRLKQELAPAIYH